VLNRPVASPEECSRTVAELRRRLGVDLLFENPEDFDQEYPLNHHGTNVVHGLSNTDSRRLPG
jgi:hypothetical protein